MDDASRGYVQMDELMDGVGQRLAELTGAEWGIVTAGCCAALTHATAACIAGSNPERMQRLPDLAGLKNEVVIPAYSRNVYDHAIRMLGVKIVVVRDPSELETAFNERTAMVYILGGPGDDGPLGTKAVSEVARKKNVPVIVDAAAEILTIPNVHLQRGATAVAYSGGKCIRGPQAAGLLLGRRICSRPPGLNSAPHHAFGRSLKVGKEEIMGMLAAVEMWVKRDHQAEWKAVGRLAGDHRGQREENRRRDHQGQPAERRPLEPLSQPQHPVGRREAGHHGAGTEQAAARHGAPHRPGVGRAAAGPATWPVRPPSRPT